MSLIQIISANAFITTLAVLALWLISIKIEDVSIIDMYFGISIVISALLAFYFGQGDAFRKTVILCLTLAWASRYSLHVISRNWGHGEDVRYSKLRDWVKDPADFKWLSLKVVFAYQGIVFFIMTLPISFAMAQSNQANYGVLLVLGACISLMGMTMEGVADYQLKLFKTNPDNKGKVLSSGVWRYSRHPNYFGNACVWWGLWLIACEAHWGWATIIGPLSITYFLTKVTGKPVLEKKMSREKPEYQEYIRTTSSFIPWFPKA